MRIRYSILNWIYKWLPIICGCHCLDDRSFHTRGIRHPVCARCEGMLLGMLIASVSGPFWHPEIGVLVICIVPMILDGGVQRVTSYESTNIRRLITGLLFGYGFLLLVVLYLAAVYRLGHSFGVQWQ